MKIIKSIGKITLTVHYDKDSKRYTDEAGNVVYLDENYLLHQISILRDAKKNTGTITLESISESRFKKESEALTKWVNKNERASNDKSSLFTMLKNKGF